jgi:hypothetical protein
MRVSEKGTALCNPVAAHPMPMSDNRLDWRSADCSAAAMDWLLGAYGRTLGSLDDAIALIGPNTGISTTLGLLDARGSALAQALTREGLHTRTPGSRRLVRSPSSRRGSTGARC